MIYVDTNVLLSLLVGDGSADAAGEWYSRQTAPLAISTWVTVEFYSHVGQRCRKGEETPRNAARIVDKFDQMVSDSFTLLTFSDAAIRRVSLWLRSADCALRTGDALHLAIALEHEAAAIVTFDDRFAHGIEKLRIPGLKVIALPTAGALQKIRQKRADYNVTERDIAKAVKWARKRKADEKARAPRLTVRG